MTDTTKPPRRPAAPGPRSRPAAGTRDDARRGEPPRPGGLTRRDEPVPPKDDARIAKVMARAGLCSRRDAEGWIAAGRVAVNGATIDSPALNVRPGDSITVDGRPLPERDTSRLFLFHKPRGLVTTARDPEGRPTIFDHLPEGLPRVVSVGRLDINTEGLMLLTNDGGLARVLELPSTGWLRRYRVRANGAIDQARLDALKGGVTIDGVAYAGIEAVLDRVQGANAWLTMGLREGKNREIKRVLESLGLAVTRLIRVSFGPFQLGDLAEGAVESVPTRVLREQLGPALAAEAGVDLDPREDAAPRSAGARRDGAGPPRPSRADPGAPRPHVAALRAAREAEAGEGRKRILRGGTADRRGRAVAVERVVPVDGGRARGDTRNARRFAAENAEATPDRQKTRAEAGRGGRAGEAAARPRRDDGERPRGPRAGRFDPKGQGERGSEAGERAPRAFRDAAERPRREGGGRFGDQGRPGGFGGKPRGVTGDGPRSGKPGGRPGGFGSERPVTGRNKRDSRPGAPKGGGFKGGAPGGRPAGGRPPRGRS